MSRIKRTRRSKTREPTAAQQKASTPVSGRKRKARRRDASRPDDGPAPAGAIGSAGARVHELDAAPELALVKLIALLDETIPLAPIGITPGGSRGTAPQSPPTLAALYKEMRWRIAALEIGMTRLRPQRREIEDDNNTANAAGTFSAADRQAIENAVATLKAQLPQPSGPPVEALEAAQSLREVGTRYAASPQAYYRGHCDTVLFGTGKSTGSQLRKTRMVSPSELAARMTALADATIQWIDSLHSPL